MSHTTLRLRILVQQYLFSYWAGLSKVSWSLLHEAYTWGGLRLGSRIIEKLSNCCWLSARISVRATGQNICMWPPHAASLAQHSTWRSHPKGLPSLKGRENELHLWMGEWQDFRQAMQQETPLRPDIEMTISHTWLSYWIIWASVSSPEELGW